MRSRAIICAAALAAMGASFGASAQGYGRPGDDRQPGHEQRDAQRGRMDQRDEHRQGMDERGHDERAGDMHRDDRRGMGNYGEREAREWHKGDRVPAEYRGHQYVVDRWQEHRLSRPPRGYEWVQVGADYVLISVRTGVIAQVAVAR